MSKALDFQSMIMALHRYWAEQGCLIWHPYYSQVGAGTMNPATFLRVLGPEPWRVGYVEPSVRPDDGRYGDNPNRLQMFYQYQVILKPDPGNPQELYLGSLEAIGIDPRNHDIRFVEDNWESPALGAWGLGWEVWLDGLEISQYTYFQQAGGVQLDPVSVELTYGLDRIAAALQEVNSFREIVWNEKHTFGDMNLQGEQEHSKYYFEVADVTRLRRIYELTEEETEAALEAGLVLPAYDYLLKLSHTFNVLDTRGAIGVTARQVYFARMRKLAARVAAAYLEQRQQLEYPFLDIENGSAVMGGVETKQKKTKLPAPTEAAPFLLEIGTEELPPGDLDAALLQLQESVPQLLDELYLEYGEVKVMGTPRRLVVYVESLAPKQRDREELVKGPPADRAFAADGEPTGAAEGFARSKGVSVEDLAVQEMEGGRYVVVKVKELGRPTIEVLSERLADLIAGLRFNKSMRWNASNVAFSRPIRWLLAMFGEAVVPFEYAGYSSANLTRGLRFSEPVVFAASNAADYFAKLDAQGVVLDATARREAVWKQIKELAAEVGGEVHEDTDLLAEVTHLVEAPTALRGSFGEEHLALPREVLVSVMKKHQRYFPVEKNGRLLPYFVALRNGGAQSLDVIAKGNEAVVRARFADAAFFVKEDLSEPLEAYVTQLETLGFQRDLGSMLEKSDRIISLVDEVAAQVGLSEDELDATRRAARLCKADLVTKMVVEMTSLQGVMGRHYALASGEGEEVATAIFEHYLPRFAGDAIPQTKPGLVVGLADRLDSLIGLFAAGRAPSGNKDPFALRRTALGLVDILVSRDLDFDLRMALEAAARQLPIETDQGSRTECFDFIVRRMQGLFREQDYRYDIVDAVLTEQGQNPAGAARAIKQLNAWVQREDWDTLLPAYARCVRITRDVEEMYSVEAKVFAEAKEKGLYDALMSAEASERSPGDVDEFFDAFKPMIPAINAFFDDVLVMAEDEKLRRNRLGLLQRVAALADGVADLSKLEGF